MARVDRKGVPQSDAACTREHDTLLVNSTKRAVMLLHKSCIPPFSGQILARANFRFVIPTVAPMCRGLQCFREGGLPSAEKNGENPQMFWRTENI